MNDEETERKSLEDDILMTQLPRLKKAALCPNSNGNSLRMGGFRFMPSVYKQSHHTRKILISHQEESLENVKLTSRERFFDVILYSPLFLRLSSVCTHPEC